MLKCATGAIGGYPIAVLTELFAAIGARPLHSRTIARSGFAAFNSFAHVFDPPTPTQRALMRVTAPATPRPGSFHCGNILIVRVGCSRSRVWLGKREGSEPRRKP